MITPTQQEREKRKLAILAEFQEGEKLYTNQVATKINVVWPVADRLLRELVKEGRLSGDKATGYIMFKKPSLLEKIRNVLHV